MIGSRQQAQQGHEQLIAHPDFNASWCQTLLSDKTIQWPPKTSDDILQASGHNSLFEKTLYHPTGIRAHLAFRRPATEQDSLDTLEDCFLLSLGTDLDGKTGRAHGGLSGVICDHISGHAAVKIDPKGEPPATATMTMDYLRPIETPCVVLARAWICEVSGRKVWVKAVVEDGEGRVLVRSKCLFVLARKEKI